jgi:hypothetical protein
MVLRRHRGEREVVDPLEVALDRHLPDRCVREGADVHWLRPLIQFEIDSTVEVLQELMRVLIAESCLRRWLKQDQLDRRERDDGLMSAERQELNALRRENARLKQEKEILRKAAAFFAREEIR